MHFIQRIVSSTFYLMQCILLILLYSLYTSYIIYIATVQCILCIHISSSFALLISTLRKPAITQHLEKISLPCTNQHLVPLRILSFVVPKTVSFFICWEIILVSTFLPTPSVWPPGNITGILTLYRQYQVMLKFMTMTSYIRSLILTFNNNCFSIRTLQRTVLCFPCFL